MRGRSEMEFSIRVCIFSFPFAFAFWGAGLYAFSSMGAKHFFFFT